VARVSQSRMAAFLVPGVRGNTRHPRAARCSAHWPRVVLIVGCTTLRVAFLTTIVPGKEPIELAERTLTAATEIVYGGTFDVWLLDEGDSDDVKEMCGRLGVRHGVAIDGEATVRGQLGAGHERGPVGRLCYGGRSWISTSRRRPTARASVPR